MRKKSIAEIKSLAISGNAKAQTELGIRYSNGIRGVEQNISEAAKWFKKAYKSKNSEAAWRLGWMYCNGTGVEEDLKKGIELLTIGAKKKIAGAQVQLAILFLSGEKVPLDYKKGTKLVRKAAKQHYPAAEYMYGFFLIQGECGLTKNSKKGFHYLYLASFNHPFDELDEEYDKMCVSNAQFRLGMAFEEGDGTYKSEANAFKCYKASADNGYDKAFLEVALRLSEGRGTAKNLDEAIKWYKKAADAGNEPAKKLVAALNPDSDGKALQEFLAAIK